VAQQPLQAIIIPPAAPATSPKLSQSRHILLPSPKPEQKYQPEQKDVETVLLQVVGGEQDEAEAMLKKLDPVLALSYGTVADKSERKFSRITGFQYAVWALDWHMWEMMLRQFNKTEHWVLAAQQYEELEKKGTAHGKAFSLQPLIDALQTYSDKYSGWTTEQCEKYWCQEVGRLQSQLPWHVVNEYCRPDRPFDPCPTFAEQKPLPRGKGREKEWLHLNGSHRKTLGAEGGDWAWGRAGSSTATNISSKSFNDVGYKTYKQLGWTRYFGQCFWYFTYHDSKALASLSKTRAQQQEELGQKVRKMAAPTYLRPGFPS
jgi:hypothetical protein